MVGLELLYPLHLLHLIPLFLFVLIIRSKMVKIHLLRVHSLQILLDFRVKFLKLIYRSLVRQPSQFNELYFDRAEETDYGRVPGVLPVLKGLLRVESNYSGDSKHFAVPNESVEFRLLLRQDSIMKVLLRVHLGRKRPHPVLDCKINVVGRLDTKNFIVSFCILRILLELIAAPGEQSSIVRMGVLLRDSWEAVFEVGQEHRASGSQFNNIVVQHKDKQFSACSSRSDCNWSLLGMRMSSMLSAWSELGTQQRRIQSQAHPQWRMDSFSRLET